MTNRPRSSPRLGSGDRIRRHRQRILGSLLRVCESLEELKVSREARLACREVAGILDSALARELTGPGSRRK